ncbi:MAG: universal stress protein [Desulfobacterales bacterium]|nr:universal stress protein [Deltaproteobacteria bacterium]NIR15663.1 universal stress protein [Desulfobacterales bacterium]
MAICFSEYCNETFTYAAHLALQLQAELMVANVINVRDVHAISTIESMGYAVSAENYVKAVKEERKSQLQDMIVDSVFPEKKIKSFFSVGHPLEELIRVIEEEKIDLVVMGSKGRSDHPRLLVGSVAERMFRHSPVTVLFYR